MEGMDEFNHVDGESIGEKIGATDKLSFVRATRLLGVLQE